MGGLENGLHLLYARPHRLYWKQLFKLQSNKCFQIAIWAKRRTKCLFKQGHCAETKGSAGGRPPEWVNVTTHVGFVSRYHTSAWQRLSQQQREAGGRSVTTSVYISFIAWFSHISHNAFLPPKCLQLWNTNKTGDESSMLIYSFGDSCIPSCMGCQSWCWFGEGGISKFE